METEDLQVLGSCMALGL